MVPRDLKYGRLVEIALGHDPPSMHETVAKLIHLKQRVGRIPNELDPEPAEFVQLVR
jgi:hypothetical protein